MSPTDGNDKKKITRSRNGCHRCKRLKSKCSEEKPSCSACLKLGHDCDYSIKLVWGGRQFKNKEKRQSPHLSGKEFKEVKLNLKAGSVNFVPSQFAVNKSMVKVEERSNPDMQIKLENLECRTDFVRASEDQDYGMTRSNSVAESAYKSEPSVPVDAPVVRQNPEIFSPMKLDDLIYQHSPLGSDSRLSELADVCTNYAVDIDRVNMQVHQDVSGVTTPDFLSPGGWIKSGIESPISPDYGKSIEMPESSFDGGRVEEVEELLTVSSIPPLLMPLPELLLRIPYYRQLFHFWVEVASNNLVPAPTLYRDNPFKVLLPQMAMHYSGVLTTILAFAAKAMQTLNGTSGNLEIIDQLLGRSCNELLRQLEDKSEATSDGTLATILLLSSYEVIHSQNFEKHRTHTYGAGQIVTARRNKLHISGHSPHSDENDGSSSSISVSSHEESNTAYFLMRWFAYVDVIGALSSTKGREKYLRTYRGKGEYRPVESISCEDEDFMDNLNREIDYLLGFDVRMFPHFVNISLLLDEVDLYMSDTQNDKFCLPQNIINAALELKEKFTEDHEAAEEKRQLLLDEMIEVNARTGYVGKQKERLLEIMNKDNILRCTNKLFFYAGLINLYRRVLLLPRELFLVQNLVTKMAEILRLFIEPASPAEICTIFCNFSCGCEVLDPQLRMFFVERFTRLAQEGNSNASKSLIIMGRCWETGEDWITAANALAIDLVLM